MSGKGPNVVSLLMVRNERKADLDAPRRAEGDSIFRSLQGSVRSFTARGGRRAARACRRSPAGDRLAYRAAADHPDHPDRIAHRSIFLDRGPIKDLVDFHLVRLAQRQDDAARQDCSIEQAMAPLIRL